MTTRLRFSFKISIANNELKKEIKLKIYVFTVYKYIQKGRGVEEISIYHSCIFYNKMNLKAQTVKASLVFLQKFLSKNISDVIKDIPIAFSN